MRTETLALQAPAVDRSRLLIVLHPNESRIDIMLSDKRFNDEEYAFSRKKEPTGNEERMLKRLKKLLGIQKAETARQELSLELFDGTLYDEFIPQVVEIIHEFTGPDFGQVVYLDDRRRDGTAYSEEGWLTNPGVPKPAPNLGVEYKIWKENK